MSVNFSWNCYVFWRLSILSGVIIIKLFFSWNTTNTSWHGILGCERTLALFVHRFHICFLCFYYGFYGLFFTVTSLCSFSHLMPMLVYFVCLARLLCLLSLENCNTAWILLLVNGLPVDALLQTFLAPCTTTTRKTIRAILTNSVSIPQTFLLCGSSSSSSQCWFYQLHQLAKASQLPVLAAALV